MDTKALIKAFIEEEKANTRAEFESLGSGSWRYSRDQREFAIRKAQEVGVRATARVLKIPRKTIQRWLKAADIQVERCPEWVYGWAHWRKKKREKWERIRAHRGH